ncbi:MAG: hypothetical protein WCJ58_00920 [bacterium]
MDYQRKQLAEICDKLSKISLEEKAAKFAELANSNGTIDLATIINAIVTHIEGRDGFAMPDLIISFYQVRFDIGMVNEDLNVKYKSNYPHSYRGNWIYEACLDIYLGLYEFGFMNYRNETIYNLLRERPSQQRVIK